jgi:putative DNA methylase
MLLAVSVTRPTVRGRQLRQPTEADFQAIAAAEAELHRLLPRWEIEDLIPTEAVPPGQKTEEPRRMGISLWRHMYTSRQLLTYGIALEEGRAIVAAVSDEKGPEEARSVALYLAFAFGKALNYNSRFNGWHPTRMRVPNVFDRHDFGFKWTFSELDGSTALLPWAMEQVVGAYRGIAGLAHRPASLTDQPGSASARVLLGSATKLDLPDGSVDAVVTDPPYYDNVMYAECSDYFYVWEKRLLRDTWPELTTQALTDKEGEAVANPSLFRDVAAPAGRGRRAVSGMTAAQLADRRYEQLLTESFKEAARVLKDDGVMTVMFTHKRVDAWDTLGIALLEAGFEISSSWPVHTESEHSLHQAKKNSASSTVLLGCRKRGSSTPAYWSDIRADVETAAEDAAQRFSAEGIKGVDLTLATYGPALSVLSRNWPVFTGTVDDDGKPLVIRPDVALDLARERVALLKKRELLGGRDVEFDRATDWWLLAWNDFQAAQFPAGEALKLCLATDLDLEDVAKGFKLIKAQSGDVTLLSPAQRRTARALDPDAAVWPTAIDALHAFMLVYDEEGLAAARRWLQRTEKGDDVRFTALVEAALHAVPRGKDKGEFVRPEARILDSIRTSLYDDRIAPIAEADLPVAQTSLFD